MSEPIDIKKRTEFFIRDLHARENMRLGWYRQFGFGGEKTRYLRERKASHIAFLRDLLRKRGLGPVWYARMFYLLGHGFGFFSKILPQNLLSKIEDVLESWILMRYRKYLKHMRMDSTLRSMIESLQLKRFTHNEPSPEVLTLVEHYIGEQEKALKGERPHAFGNMEVTL